MRAIDDSVGPRRSLFSETQAPPLIAEMEDHIHIPSNSRLAHFEASNSRPSTDAAVFLDRDGVLVEDVHHLAEPNRLKILPGAVAGLRALESRFYIIVVTNQSGIARGLFTEADLLLIHTELVRRMLEQGVLIDALCYCPHLPDAPVAAYRVVCDCRKPAPGMLFRAKTEWGIDLAQSYLVGDMPSDIQAGRAAGVKTVLVGQGATKASKQGWAARDMVEAAGLILADTPHHDGAPPSQAVISLPLKLSQPRPKGAA